MAFFYRGLVYECNVLDGGTLTIEGRPIAVAAGTAPDLHQYARRIIDEAPEQSSTDAI